MKKSTLIKITSSLFVLTFILLILAIFIEDLQDWWKWLDIPEPCVCVCQEKNK